MLDKELFENIFEIKAPWRITRIEKQLKQKRVDIWIEKGAEKKRMGEWLKRNFSLLEHSQTCIWQHFTVGECRIYIHAVPMREAHLFPWLGEEGIPFTHALTRRIVELLSERLSYRAICSLQDVDLQDVWLVKHALDKGELTLGVAQSSAHQERKNVMADSAATEADDRIPPIEDPVWLKVLSNDVDIKIRQLGLQLLVSRVRKQFHNANDDDTRLLRMNELRKYFVKHEQFLQYELKQMVA